MENLISLDELNLNQSAKIYDISCQEHIKRRLLDLGMINGTNIIPVLKSPFGDPTAFEVRGTIIALRKEDSNLIKVSF